MTSQTPSPSLPLPHSIEAEEALLGAVLINPGIFPALNVKPGDFFIQRYGWVWQAVGSLHANKVAVDFLTVSEALDAAGRLQEFGGTAKLAALLTQVPSSLNAESYAGIVVNMSERRKLLGLANEIARAAYDLELDLEDIRPVFVDDLQRTGGSRRKGAVPISEWKRETLEVIEHRRENPDSNQVLKTGFVDLDHFIGGLDPDEGTQFILGGQPGAGKTILLGNMNFFLAQQAPGACYSMEMKRKRMMMRAFSEKSRLSAWGIREGKIDQGEWEHLQKSTRVYDDLPLFVSDDSDWTTATLRADLLRLKQRYNIKWYTLDYLKLLCDQGGTEKEHERLALLSQRLMQINRSLGLCSIIVHTMTKDNFQSKELNGGAFAGGAGLQYDMDVGAVLVNNTGSDTPFSHDFEMKKLVFVKNRDGETPLGELDLAKHKTLPYFVTPEVKTVVLNGKNGHHRENPLTAPVLVHAPEQDDWWDKI